VSEFRTRVFDLAAEYGYLTNTALAEAMGIDQSLVSRVRNGERPVTRKFIAGALKAFPDRRFEDLFFLASDHPRSDETRALAS
jgi:hypothetical protein